MTARSHSRDRRAFLGALGLAAFYRPGVFAEALVQTPATTEGPFYPDRLPLDTDNDLLIINDATTPAVGEIALLSGRILSPSGEPMRNAFVEIWQCDARQSYLHTRGRGAQVDANFQGYGRFMTDSTGAYAFRTIKPVPYTLAGQARAPHIHIAVSRNGRRVFTTQIGIRGHADNAGDIVFKAIKDPKTLDTLMADFKPVAASKIGELAARFDVVLGRTAAEGEDGKLQGGVGKPEGLRRR